jgi:hypothetical protein
MKKRTRAITPNDIKRFWSKVDRSGGPDTCWPWLARTDKDGYGKFQYGPHGGQTHVRAHVFSLRLHKRQTGPVARHYKCYSPPCCNWRHLKWGTPSDNRQDTVRAGREPIGEEKPTTKLTAADVQILQEKYKKHVPHAYNFCARYAREYGVSKATVQHAVTGLNWKWLR